MSEFLGGLFEGPTEEPAVSLTIPLNPLPAPRPRARVVRAKKPFVQMYNPRGYMDHKKAIVDAIGEGSANLAGPLLVIATFFVEQPKSSKLTHPKPDLDNYLKTVFDAITDAGGYWEDDKQVIATVAYKSWAPAGEPGWTFLTIHEWTEDTRG